VPDEVDRQRRHRRRRHRGGDDLAEVGREDEGPPDLDHRDEHAEGDDGRRDGAGGQRRRALDRVATVRGLRLVATVVHGRIIGNRVRP
jgi:hypothetical protein